jgi:hypothetical protein
MKKFILASFLGLASLVATLTIASACPPGFQTCNICTGTEDGGSGLCTVEIRACCATG